MELLETDALWKTLSQFRRSDELHSHRSQVLRYTAGVKYLAERCALFWLIDLIASSQSRALSSDPDLAIFQLWELRRVGGKRVISCLRDSETLAFQIVLPSLYATELHSMRLYVEFDVLMLPGEKSKAPWQSGPCSG
jgi:hypothetical protein